MTHGEHAPKTSGRVIRSASRYDMLVKTLLMGKETKVRKMTVDLAHLQPGERVLDVGCGTGSLTIEAKRRLGATGLVHGIDAAPEMVALARQKAEAAGVDVEFQVATAERLPYPDDHFDVVLSSLVLHHLPLQLRRQVLAEIRRVLKPDGRLLVVDFEPPKTAVGKLWVHALLGHGMGQNNIRENLPLLRDSGFVQVEQGRTGHPLLSYLRARLP